MIIIDKPFGKGDDSDDEEIWRKLEPKVAPLARPAIQLIKTTESTRSWLGGKPKADTAQFQWPCHNEKPMAFLAQLDLSELAAAHRFDWLPDQGSLLFFYVYEEEKMVWGHDPKDSDHWRVILAENPGAEINFPKNLDRDFRFNPLHISAHKVDVLPRIGSDEVNALKLSDEESDVYDNYTNSEGETPLHQAGGFPFPIQENSMDLDCQMIFNGIEWQTQEEYENAKAKAEPDKKDWRLLFQMDTDDDLGVMWGDCGFIYFWIREQDARNKQFDNAWLILQCC